ncbi:MAG TPA: hypothetical protein DCQ06_13190 [Myxococcales bacterium]|nr:hypothetical protein [Myxococcales bacterium]HAN32544.1 hypothetical protein [Myxococcales bacterium]
MPSLRDRTFNSGAWARLAMVAGGLGIIGGLIYVSVHLHERHVRLPHLLSQRHSEPVGYPGMATSQLAHYGGEAVDTLLADLDPKFTVEQRSKSIEILSAIDDPRVIPALVAALKDSNLTIRIAALAGIARTKRPELTQHLWPLTEIKDAFLRQRAIIAIGLISTEPQHPKLRELAKEVAGAERLLYAWALGYSILRAKLTDPATQRVRPLTIRDDAHASDVQAEVDSLHELFATKGVSNEAAERYAQLITVDFGTWNLAHQMSYQTVVMGGPTRTGRVRYIEKVQESGLEPNNAKPLPTQRPSRGSPLD